MSNDFDVVTDPECGEIVPIGDVLPPVPFPEPKPNEPGNRRIYLAGPITGLSYEDARNGWRKEFKRLITRLAPHIECYSPMRAKQFLADQKEILGDPGAYQTHPMAVSRGIITRDLNDVMSSDAIVANLKGASLASVGTISEIAWSFLLRKPLIVILGEDEHDNKVNPHWHVFIKEMTGYTVPTLEEAAYIAGHLLTPGI